MNPESQEPVEPNQEARLTALLLGELPETEAEEVRKAIQSDPELARLHERLKRTVALVREALEPPLAGSGGQTPKPRLAEDRRRKLLEQFKVLTPKEFSPARRRGLHWSVPLAAAAVLVLMGSLAALLLLPSLVRAKSKSMAGLARVTVASSQVQEAFAREELRRVERYAEGASEARGRRTTTVGQVLDTDVRSLGEAAPSTSPSTAKIREVRGDVALGRRFSSNAPHNGAELVRKAPAQQLYLPPVAADSYGDYAQARVPAAPRTPQEAEKAGVSELALLRDGMEAKSDVTSYFGRGAVGGPAGQKAPGMNDKKWGFETAGPDASPSPKAGNDIAGRPDSLALAPAPATPAPVQPPGHAAGGRVGGRAVRGEAVVSAGNFEYSVNNLSSESIADLPKQAGGEPSVQAGGAITLDSQTFLGVAGKPVEARTPVLGDTPQLGALFFTDADSQAAGVPRRGSGTVAVATAAAGYAINADGLVPAVSANPKAAARERLAEPASGPVETPAATAMPAVALQEVADASTALMAGGAATAGVGGVEGGVVNRDLASTIAPLAAAESRAKYPARPAKGQPATESKGKIADSRMMMRYGLVSQESKPVSTVAGDVEVAGTAIVSAEVAKKKAESIVEKLVVVDGKDSSAIAPEGRLAKQLAAAKGVAVGDALLVTNAEPPAVRRAVAAAEPQPEVPVAANAFSTFSLNVTDVSFKLASASLENGAMPDPATVRSEEFINAFDYQDPAPAPGARVGFTWERARYPFAHSRDLIRLAVRTAARGREAGRPLNLVLLLDNSGSMERADRVRIIREALRVLASQLQPQDQVSVVAFARRARLWVDGLSGAQAGELVERVGNLTPEGGTNLEDALSLAYATALRHYAAQGNNRVVLLTDGAANLGDVEPESLRRKVESFRRQGIALDCFGIGWEGYNDDLLEALARNGDGRYGFVNTPEEAASEFAAQLTGALQVAASDVKVQVEFNPRRVNVYRQIGYAKHQLTKEQFRDNTVDAAELGAAESGNALYVIETLPQGDGDIGWVRVRFRLPGTSDYREQEWPIPYTGEAPLLDKSSPALRLAASASAFSEWLVSSPFAEEVTSDRLIECVSGVANAFGPDPRPKRLEWMIRQAKSLGGR